MGGFDPPGPPWLEVGGAARRGEGWPRQFECFRRVPDFDRALIHSSRQCADYYPWQQGFTPKEHVAMQEIRQAQVDEQMESRRQARIARLISIGLGIGTILAVLVMGLLNLFLGR